MKHDAIPLVYIKTVNELAEEKWTPIMKRKGGVRQLKKGDGSYND